ncbi:hypothetical protein F4561_001710 [Lipingzhangella halophila]|uniref:Uncharacterized protein n=1 Tax=Lipingzhangella halophila TaxID=1783352 RepID=A0A7W7RFG7_9ACTN|nr:hypothetical protein [Lipingzhangella halophila]MBB4930890.1 hypothetical protein [Lipingzhangella halophila]
MKTGSAMERKGGRECVQELGSWARQHDWSYAEEGGHLRGSYGGPPFLSEGAGTYRHVLTGEHRGWSVLAFEYSYPNIHAESLPRTWDFQVVTVRIPQVPRLEATDARLTDMLLDLVGASQHSRTGDRQFDQIFRVRTDDHEFARQVLRPETRRWMIRDPRTLDTPFRFAEESLLTWQNRVLDPSSALERADFLIDLLERTPADVLGEDPSGPPAD